MGGRLIATLVGKGWEVRALARSEGARERVTGLGALAVPGSLADAALLRGADVTTLLCNAAVRPAGGTVVATPTAADLEREALARAVSADVVLMAAAVADYRPAEVGGEKRPRSGDWSLELVAYN